MKLTAATRVFAVLGDPVGHSLSPVMHNAGFRAAGLDAVYVALRPETAALAHQIATLVHNGGGGNITLPFKRAAAEIAATRDEEVIRLSAANVFGSVNGALHLGNTDVAGVLAAVERLQPSGDAWCILGTGGSARSVVGAAAARGVRVAVVSRDRQRGAEFAAWARTLDVDAAEADECALVVNATPLGLAEGDRFPMPPADLASGTAVLDLVYTAAGVTGWVAACLARGLRAIDGRATLLAQGVASWRYWFPDLDPPVEVMRAALDRRLG
ncbi:MAG: shikimate dehydrogenase family protein [Gemmatimonadales bacterium]